MKIIFVRRKTGKPFNVPLQPWAEKFVRIEIKPRFRQGKPVFVAGTYAANGKPNVMTASECSLRCSRLPCVRAASK